MVKKFTENTLLPVSLVITILGAVFWLATLASRTDALGETVSRITTHNQERDVIINDALQKLERIDTKVDYIYEVIKEQREKRNR